MIVWHLQRYHNIKVSHNGCYRVLVRNKLNRLPENIKNDHVVSSRDTKKESLGTMFRLIVKLHSNLTQDLH